MNLVRIFICTFSLLLAACKPPEQETVLYFSPVVNGETIDCNSKLEINETEWELSQLQFYLSNLAFRGKDSEWHLAHIVANSNESHEVSLIGGVCPEAGVWALKLNSTIDPQSITEVKFDIGVPFNLNHLDPLTQPSPLNQSDMFWTWQMGHKFVRLELHNNKNEVIYHLGSTGCTSPAPVRSPSVECKNPNRPTIQLSYSADKTVQFDIGQLFDNVDLSSGASCQSSPDNPICETLLSRSGIGSKQSVFKVSQ